MNNYFPVPNQDPIMIKRDIELTNRINAIEHNIQSGENDYDSFAILSDLKIRREQLREQIGADDEES